MQSNIQAMVCVVDWIRFMVQIKFHLQRPLNVLVYVLDIQIKP